MEKTLNKIFEELFARYSIKEEHLLWDAELEGIDIEKLNKNYIDTGWSDIDIDLIKNPIDFEGKKIIGYRFTDKYLYGRENNTRKRYSIKFYYNKNEN